MPDIRALATAFAESLPEILAMTERVVNIDSGSYDAAGVNAVIDVWSGELAAMGFAIQRRPLPGRGDQLTAHLLLGEGPHAVVLGHADTVWPAGTVADWRFGHADGRLTGPGVGDMKTNVVMALFGLRILLRQGLLAGLGRVTVLIVPDEEIGSPQSRGWIEAETRHADLCLTLEPARPGGGTVIGRGAVGAAYLHASGVTAHAGAARTIGASAISLLAPLVSEIEALGDIEAGAYATVGIFRGGAARQVVPGEAELHLDLRAPDAAAAETLWQRIAAIAARPPADPRTSLVLSGGFTRPAFPDLPAMHALYDLAAGFSRELEAPIAKVISRGGSDGSFAAALGVPSLDGLGPVGHEICSRREWVELASVVPRGAILAGLLAAAAEGRTPRR